MGGRSVRNSWGVIGGEVVVNIVGWYRSSNGGICSVSEGGKGKRERWV